MEHAGKGELIEQLMQKTWALAWAVRQGTKCRPCGQTQLIFSRVMALKTLAQTGARNAGDVASFLGVSEPAAGRIIDKLVGRKLLQRIEGNSDRHTRELSLTPAAWNLLSEFDIARRRLLAGAFSECSPEDVHLASEVLDRVVWWIASHGHTANGGEKSLTSAFPRPNSPSPRGSP